MPLPVFSYDPETGEYKGKVEAEEDPMANDPKNMGDGFLHPAYTVKKKPPKPKKDTVPVFKKSDGTVPITGNAPGAEWRLEEDYRGRPVWDKQTKGQVIITSIGSIPEQFTKKRPTSDLEEWDGEKWALNIEKLKEEKQLEITKEVSKQLPTSNKHSSHFFRLILRGLKALREGDTKAIDSILEEVAPFLDAYEEADTEIEKIKKAKDKQQVEETTKQAVQKIKDKKPKKPKKDK